MKTKSGSMKVTNIKPLKKREGFAKLLAASDVNIKGYASPVSSPDFYYGLMPKEFATNDLGQFGLTSNEHDVTAAATCKNTQGTEYLAFKKKNTLSATSQCSGDGSNMFKIFTNTLKDAPSEIDTIFNDDSKFAYNVEMNFGGKCGMEAQTDCYQAVAVGIPFELAPGECEIRGDPHITTFDGTRFDNQNIYLYVLYHDGRVRVEVQLFKMQKDDRVSYVQDVTIYDETTKQKIKLRQDGSVRYTKGIIDIVLEVDIYTESTLIELGAGNPTVTLANDVRVYWNPKRRQVLVTVPRSLSGQTSGLCGNFNGDKTDDFTMSTFGACDTAGGDIVPGQIAATAELFSASNLVKTDKNDWGQTECASNTRQEEVTCADASMEKATAHCEMMYDITGRFKECLAEIPEDIYNDIRQACIDDTCLVGDIDDTVKCNQAENFASECRIKHDIQFEQSWRSDDFCPAPDCPTENHEHRCGYSGEPSCLNPAGHSSGKCQEGCYCKKGLYSDGLHCVPPTECGCVHDGVMYKVGDTILSADCSRQAVCQPLTADNVHSDRLEWKLHSCGAKALCLQDKEGVRQCTCQEGYQMVEDKCIGETGVCEASGDPHYSTFDGKKIAFQGNCQYTLTSNDCNLGHSGKTFSVVVSNTFFGKNQDASITKDVKITYGEEIIRISTADLVVLHGHVEVNLPFISEPIHIAKEKNTVVTLDNGIKVYVSDKGPRVWVKATDAFTNQLCGICGNFNNDDTDDLTMGSYDANNRFADFIRPGEQASTSFSFVFSWTVKEDNGIANDCSDEHNMLQPEKVCTTEQHSIANEICDEAFTHESLSECVESMDKNIQEQSFDDCLYDMCKYIQAFDADSLESSAMLKIMDDDVCGIIDDLVNECVREERVTKIPLWRRDNFCSLECGKNMQYTRGNYDCQPTCGDLKGTENCEENQEGCFCLDGYVFTGSECIKPSDCGCQDGPTLLPPGEFRLDHECKTKHICPEHGHTIHEEDSGCHESSKCVLENNKRQCVCSEEDGFYGNAYDECLPIPEEALTNEPCKKATHKCSSLSRSECMAKLGHLDYCGVGLMLEQRNCPDQDGNDNITIIQRDCCVNNQHCPPTNKDKPKPEEEGEGPPPGTDSETDTDKEDKLAAPKPIVRCQDVFPECVNNEVIRIDDELNKQLKATTLV